MPSSYSTNLKLELMATGEDNNIWGVTTNTNLGTLIEQAIVGSGAVAIADTNTTISISNGATSAARCIVLSLTGALTNQRDLTVPTINKPYIIVNGTTGGFGVQVKTAAGTGIVVPMGKRRFLYADGTNVVDMLDSLAALTVAGSAITVGGFTITPGGNVATAGAVTFAGAFGATLNVTALTSITLPTTGTLATLAGAESLSNKTLVTPVLGVATATSINKVALTAPATGSTLTISDGKTLAATASLTLSGTDSTTMTFPGTTDTVVTLTASQTLTNKTLTTAALGSSTATTQTALDNSTKVATTAYVDTAIAGGVPAGVVVPYAGASAPTGWLLAFGQSLVRTDYAALFSAIGTTYGSADGTHFNVPDLRGRVAAGADAMGGSAANRLGSGLTGGVTGSATPAATGGEQSHTLSSAESASHVHGGVVTSTGVVSGLFGVSVSGDATVVTSVSDNVGSTGASGSGGGHNNVQPTLVTNFIIKT